MLHDLIYNKAHQWILSDDCPANSLFRHFKNNGNLREAQIQALLVYLYLKLEGGNKPLATLFKEGYFSQDEDLSSLNINQQARTVLENNKAAKALFALSRIPIKNNSTGKKTLFPDLEKHIVNNPSAIDYDAFGKQLFYGVGYTDYLFSLPMGAGKTFLMAAIIYLDLYFAVNEPDNPQFAHNFLILAPSGLKSSIIPSLKTIERFDPSWILPEPAASNINRLIRFEILDQPKSSNKSNKARNPNAQKVSSYQPFDSLMGLVLVVNAEKVILDRLELSSQLEVIEKTSDEKDRYANELRNIIGRIPNLQIHIDEVHHAATDDIKLRQVVNKWNESGSINSVLGFSGTPYLASPETIKLSNDIQLKFTQITNTVFYYPLTIAIKKFLKKPRVEETKGLASLQIIDSGVKDFLGHYGNTLYANGSMAKLAIYCGSIERLEEEVYPHLIGKMKLPPEALLKYHRGNKKHKITQEAETEFNSLDTPLSKKQIILLVQIGKEGWDCRSLTGVILSQKGDCPANMVLQTACRCLRQVEKSGVQTAVIWLNEDNAKTLDKQLKEEQHTSIKELNNLGKNGEPDKVGRFSRMEYLKLPKIDYYQLSVEYETLVTETEVNADVGIQAINPANHLDTAVIIERTLSKDGPQRKDVVEKIEGGIAEFERWLFDIARESLGVISQRTLFCHEKALQGIFNTITYEDSNSRVFNHLFRQDEIKTRVRLAFHRHRELNIRAEIIPYTASLLVLEKLTAAENHDKLYPTTNDVRDILNADNTGQDIASLQREIQEAQQKIQDFIASLPNPDLITLAGLDMPTTKPFSKAVIGKDKSFHYLPYDFRQSRFEMKFLQELIGLGAFLDAGLEVYYNGERHLTEFRIVCFEQKNNLWHRIGWYTPDFIVIKRLADTLHKILIVETKGSGFAEQTAFKARRRFVESEFLKMNNEKFGYQRFDFLYLPDDTPMNANLASFQSKITDFFNID
ncbi:MAG: DEAD/DEAH box helicase family protein [Proteobacteria bacterium]|nr:DEAD/DEAH box helicase family protein [Pseudomonadota bacterium]